MTKFPKKEIVVDAVLKGIEHASENFLTWTNGRLFLSHGPHKIISIHVAQEIAKIDDAPEIFIDATISDILKCSLKNREDYADFMYKQQLSQGTFPITLDKRFAHKSDEDSISKVVISVANSVRNAKLEYLKEIENICKILNVNDGSLLDYGVFCFYSDLSTNARKKLNKRIPEIVNSFTNIVNKYPYLQARFVDSGVKTIEGSGEWLAGCFIIEPK